MTDRMIKIVQTEAAARYRRWEPRADPSGVEVSVCVTSGHVEVIARGFGQSSHGYGKTESAAVKALREGLADD